MKTQIQKISIESGLRQIFFPSSGILLLIIFGGWMASFILLAIIYNITKKITPSILLASAIPLVPCYFLSWLNLSVRLKKKISEGGRAAKLNISTKIHSDCDSWEVPVDPNVEKVTWDEVILQKEVKREIQRALTLMLEPERFSDLGKKAPKGLLLYGPPGTGKTTIAKAIASQGEMAFISVSAGELTHSFFGTSEARIRHLFNVAVSRSPCIVFIDEIDSLLVRRGSNVSNTFKDEMVMEFLQMMDGVTTKLHGKVIIVGATNRKDKLDEAVLRPGRFDKHIEIPLPDASLREKLWELFLSGKPLGNDIDLLELTNKSEGFSGAEIHGVVDEAIDSVIDRVEMETSIDRILLQNDLLKAMAKIGGNKTEVKTSVY